MRSENFIFFSRCTERSRECCDICKSAQQQQSWKNRSFSSLAPNSNNKHKYRGIKTQVAAPARDSMQIYEALGRVHGSLETNGDVIQTHLLADLFLFFSNFFFQFSTARLSFVVHDYDFFFANLSCLVVVQHGQLQFFELRKKNLLCLVQSSE